MVYIPKIPNIYLKWKNVDLCKINFIRHTIGNTKNAKDIYDFSLLNLN